MSAVGSLLSSIQDLDVDWIGSLHSDWITLPLYLRQVPGLVWIVNLQLPPSSSPEGHTPEKILLETTTAIACDSPPFCCPSSRSVDELRTKGRGLPFCSTGRLVRRPPRAQTRKKPTRYFAWSGSNNPPDQSLDFILVARRYTVRVSLRLCTTDDSPPRNPNVILA